MREVIVAIPSFRRPRGLERLLRALERLETSAHVSILVADNDAERQEAVSLCAELNRRHYRWPLTAIVAAERGIAQARNALIDHVLIHSSAEFVAMLDDDEWPEPAWLEAFLDVQRKTRADALHGAVLRDFEAPPSRSTAQCHGLAALRHSTGPVPMIDSTSNVLVRRACFEELAKPCFDVAFALSGGEDRDFFERLRRKRRRFAWADDAIVHAWVPASRASFGWALRRAYRTGNSDMRVILKHLRRRTELLPELLKVVAAAAIYPLMLPFAMPFANIRANALCKLCRAAGKGAALLGHRYDEYAVVHGA